MSTCTYSLFQMPKPVSATSACIFRLTIPLPTPQPTRNRSRQPQLCRQSIQHLLSHRFRSRSRTRSPPGLSRPFCTAEDVRCIVSNSQPKHFHHLSSIHHPPHSTYHPIPSAPPLTPPHQPRTRKTNGSPIRQRPHRSHTRHLTHAQALHLRRHNDIHPLLPRRRLRVR